jgi:hypothetical protein
VTQQNESGQKRCSPSDQNESEGVVTISRVKTLQGTPQNEWVKTFLRDIRLRIEEGRDLTGNQTEKLNQLWKK